RPHSTVVHSRRPTPPSFPYTALFRSGAPTGDLSATAGSRGAHAEDEMRVDPDAARGEHQRVDAVEDPAVSREELAAVLHAHAPLDRKSTRLNSSHVKISYAVFCLKKK